MTWTFDATQFWIISSRLSGMLLMIPAIGQVPLPAAVRAGLVVWLSLALSPTVKHIPWNLTDTYGFAVGMGFEFLLGMGLGYIMRLAFAIVEIGGTILDNEIGFRAAQQMDPTSSVGGGPISKMLVWTSLLYFWFLDYFSIMIMALRESFVLVPPFALNVPTFDLNQIVQVSAGIFAGGLVMAAPILALMFAINVGFGFIAKSVPGINFFFEIFIVRILVGVAGLVLFLPLILMIMREQFARIIPAIGLYLRSFA